jgi:hypothetical protein
MTAKGKLGDFDPFENATPSTSPGPQAVAEPSAEVDAGAGTHPAVRGRQRAAQPRRGTSTGSAAAPLPKHLLNEWRHRLRSAAGTRAAARARLNEADELWSDVVAGARAAGVPEAMVQAAALDVGETPPPADQRSRTRTRG